MNPKEPKVDIQHLVRAYVPRVVRSRLSNAAWSGDEPHSEELRAAVVMADISGFSALADKLGRQGHGGAEALQIYLNDCFGRQIELIQEHGGELWRFAGDACIALWIRPSMSDAELTTRAVRCASEMQRQLGGSNLSSQADLHLRIGVGIGSMVLARVGGLEDAWEAVLGGEALDQAVSATEQAEVGEVLLSEQVWSHVCTSANGEALEGTLYRLESLGDVEVPPVHQPPPETADGGGLIQYVPRSVRERLQAGQMDWLGEFRRVSVLFAGIQGIDYAKTDALMKLHTAIRTMQEIVHQCDGCINQVVADDKGTVLIAVWGISHYSHADDAARATLAGMNIRDALSGIDMDAAIGLSSGTVFAGNRGNEDRLEYALIGTVVNLAARLMGTGELLLCDDATKIAALTQAAFEPLSPIRVKGRAEPVRVFKPVKIQKQERKTAGEFFGREREQEAIATALRLLDTTDTGGIMVIEGDAGLGKSALMAKSMESVPDSIRSVLVRADAVERSTPYYPWRKIFEELLQISDVSDTAEREQKVLKILPGELARSSHLQLLNSILNLSFAETQTTLEMGPSARGDGIRNLLVNLFKVLIPARRFLLVLEDAHWLDSGSWALAAALYADTDSMLVVATTRPPEEEVIDDVQHMLERPEVNIIRLDRLTDSASLQLACKCLGVPYLPDGVASFITRKSDGHPLYVETLAYMLREQHYVSIEGGECRVLVSDQAIETADFPNTIHGVVAQRIDGLTVQEQMTLKVASVIGLSFSLDLLRYIHPADDGEQAITDQLVSLCSTRLLEKSGDRLFRFQHVITREVAYGLLPFEQRHRLHRGIAGWIEQNKVSEADRSYQLLAHHWQCADVPDRALEYLTKAAEQALWVHYANEEAVRFFREALDLISAVTRPPSKIDLARAYRQLGEAEDNLGFYLEGAADLERSLNLLGERLPDTSARWLIRAAGELIRQLCRIAIHWPVRKTTEERINEQLEVVRAYTRLGATYYIMDRRSPFIATLLSAVNRAETLPLTPELARSYADMSTVAGIIPWHALARSYWRLALESAAELDDPTTNSRVWARVGIYSSSAADWTGQANLEGSMKIAEHLGDKFQWQESAFVLAQGKQIQGRFMESMPLFREVQARAEESHTMLHQIWALSGQADAALGLGKLDEAENLAEVTLELIRESSRAHQDIVIKVRGIITSSLLRLGRFERAARSAYETLELIELYGNVGYQPLPGFSAVAETYLTLAGRNFETADSLPAATRASNACKLLDKYAKKYRPAEPRALLYQGCCEWLESHQKSAIKLIRASIERAEELGLIYDAGLARLELARRLESIGEDAQSYRADAVELFDSIGASSQITDARNLGEKA